MTFLDRSIQFVMISLKRASEVLMLISAASFSAIIINEVDGLIVSSFGVFFLFLSIVFDAIWLKIKEYKGDNNDN